MELIGQSIKIYIPIWLDLLSHGVKTTLLRLTYLHSNMVRFIILKSLYDFPLPILFTFQYG